MNVNSIELKVFEDTHECEFLAVKFCTISSKILNIPKGVNSVICIFGVRCKIIITLSGSHVILLLHFLNSSRECLGKIQLNRGIVLLAL